MSPLATLTLDFELPLGRFPLRVAVNTQKQVTGLFGPSGSGKTSFLEVVAGLRRGAAGRVQLGEAVWQDTATGQFVPTERRGIGYVPQEGLLFPHLTVEENLRYGRRANPKTSGDPGATLKGVIELLELGSLLQQSARVLSGGERQRVALGRALCSGPKILLLDEPLAALDDALRRRILPFIRRIRDEFEIPMILVSHDRMEVQALCDDLLLLSNGEVVAQGEPREVLVNSAALSDRGGRGFTNVIPCATLSSEGNLTTVELGSAGSNISLSLFSADPNMGSSRFVSIPGQDIILATEHPQGLSARNIHAGEIEKIHHLDNFSLVSVRLGPAIPSLVAEVTRASCDTLGLIPGTQVFLVIKSMACTLYADRPSTEHRQLAPES